MYEEEWEKIKVILDQLVKVSNSKVVFLVDKSGQLIAASGEYEDFDGTSLASLASENVQATGGLAKIIAQKEFSIMFQEGERDNLFISVVGDRWILVVIFDKRSNLEMVRSDSRTAIEQLAEILDQLKKKGGGSGPGSSGGGAGGPGGPRGNPAENVLTDPWAGPEKESVH
jgi:predicted regulator of Ras-like GTPase activity (Roadblock/LC7/MglB family)